MNELKCIVCNTQFIAKRDHARYCSLKCKSSNSYITNIDYYKNYNKNISLRHKESLKYVNCLNCNTTFKQKNIKSKCCSVRCTKLAFKKARAFKWKTERVCSICENTFIPKIDCQRFCSERCQYKNERGYFRKEDIKKDCLKCKTEFDASLKQKYCSVKCRKAMDYILNKESKIHNARMRRVRKKELGGTFTLKEWNDLKAKFNYTCTKCGKIEPEVKLSVDHIIPLSKWKEWSLEHKPDYLCGSITNIQPLCLPCNQRKKNYIL